MDLANLTKDEKQELLEILEEQDFRVNGRKFYEYFPEEDNKVSWSVLPLLKRSGYQKHLDFFAEGANYKQRCFMAANRVGKSLAGAYELTCHLTGVYPEWWEGKRFEEPINAWACGDRSKTVRDTIQKALLGEMDNFGTGLIPRELIKGKPHKSMGNAETYDTVNVKHVSGGTSTVQFKTYEQGRKAFEGWEGHVVWLDEEPPIGIYQECLLRTATTKGIVYVTFTPLMGMSDVVLSFVEATDEHNKELFDPGKIIINATWDDAPHLDEQTKKELYAALPPHQRDIRAKGIPQIGAGAVYPISAENVFCDPFEIPGHFIRCFGLDVGWNKTAAVWLAVDPDTNTHYIYAEHYMGEAEPIVHIEAIKSRGEWIPGCIDPASRGRSQADGQQLFEKYKERLETLEPARNAVEAGIFTCWELMYSGKLKIFNTLPNTKREFGKYSRDHKGHIKKVNDHLMDAIRYAVYTNNQCDLAIMKPKPSTEQVEITPFSAF